MYRSFMSIEPESTKMTPVQYSRIMGNILEAIGDIVYEYPSDSSVQVIMKSLSNTDKQNHFKKMFKSCATRDDFDEALINQTLGYKEQCNRDTFDLARYCYKLWNANPKNHTPELLEQLVSGHLKSMASGNKLARQLFPNLLTLLMDQENETIPNFKLKANQVPLWMFLPWINQILSYLNWTNAAKYFTEILVKIAHEFPEAIRYPFMLSQECIDNDNEGGNGLIQKLSAILKPSSWLNRFMNELSNVSLPNIRSEDFLKAQIGSGSQGGESWEQI